MVMIKVGMMLMTPEGCYWGRDGPWARIIIKECGKAAILCDSKCFVQTGIIVAMAATAAKSC